MEVVENKGGVKLNSDIKIFTLSGKAEHGKNFTADLIQGYYETKYNKRVCQLANGNYLKFLSKLAGWNGNKDEEGREFLQQFGTEYIRNTINDDFWVDEIIQEINILKKYYDIFLITDTRFPNEIHKLNDTFGIENVVSIHVYRLNEDSSIYVSNLTKEQLNHPSETALNNFEFDEDLINQSESYLRDDVSDMVDMYEKYWSEVNND